MKRILTTLAQKWPEYLLEIFVLIIGIYGAFAVDNWNEERKERQVEQTLLKQLREEYRSNLTQLDSKIETRIALIKSSKELLGYFDKPETAQLDSVLDRMSYLGLTITYDPINNDLVSSGDINKISDQPLKAMLTEWSSDVIQVQEVETIYLNRYNNDIYPICVKLGVQRSLDELFLEKMQVLDFMLDKDNIKSIDFGTSRFTPTIDVILNHAELEGVTSNSIMINEFINLESATLRKQILEILEKLQDQIQ